LHIDIAGDTARKRIAIELTPVNGTVQFEDPRREPIALKNCGVPPSGYSTVQTV
jgi:hypothetical protein